MTVVASATGLFRLILVLIALLMVVRYVMKYKSSIEKKKWKAQKRSFMEEMDRVREHKLRNMGKTEVINEPKKNTKKSSKVNTDDAVDVDYTEV
jgi:uncharacterized ion transporter superfamily protein YfcC